MGKKRRWNYNPLPGGDNFSDYEIRQRGGYVPLIEDGDHTRDFEARKIKDRLTQRSDS
jgi:hypothetical protein